MVETEDWKEPKSYLATADIMTLINSIINLY